MLSAVDITGEEEEEEEEEEEKENQNNRCELSEHEPKNVYGNTWTRDN